MVSKKPRGRNGGRPVKFQDGLALIHVNIRQDQLYWLNRQPNKSDAIRQAIDLLSQIKAGQPGEEEL